MKYSLKTSKNFLHDLKTCKKRGYDINKLWNIIGKLQDGTPLPQLLAFFRLYAVV